MPIQHLFGKKEQELPLSSKEAYVGQLFKMAHSDGHMDECEYHFILKVAQRFQLEVDFEDLHNRLPNLSFNPDAKDIFGFDLLFDLSWMILVDGEVDEKELQLGTEIATLMGYNPNRVKKIVSAIADQKKLGLPPLEIKEKLALRFTPNTH